MSSSSAMTVAATLSLMIARKSGRPDSMSLAWRSRKRIFISTCSWGGKGVEDGLGLGLLAKLFNGGGGRRALS